MKQEIPKEMMPIFAEEEQVLWSRVIKKGLVFKKVIEVQTITNMAIRLNRQWFMFADVDHIVLTDKHTISDSAYQGYSIRVGNGMRMSTGAGRGKSIPFADMTFFTRGKIVLTLQDVQDASGVKQLIQAANPHIR
jgi:hypothetical protein